jgi:D-galactarolactone cycloisomerase
MKVESVEAFPMRIRAREKLQGGTFGYTHYQTVLVKAVVDGIEGWGESMTRSDPDATALMVRFLSRGMEGRNFKDVRTAWGQAWRELRIRGHTRGVDVEALSGIEIALYDCLGKLLAKPLGYIFSRAPSAFVPAFAGSLFASRGPLDNQVEEVRSRGLMGAKVKVGFGVEADRRTLARVRRRWPDGMMVADANGAYDAVTASKACAAFSDLGLAWFEEPVLSDDLEGYASLKGSQVKIGAGESWFVDDFRRPLEEGMVGLVEPSVSRCGGIGVEMEVAKRASALGISFSPMTGMNSALSLAASLHAAAAYPSVGVEYNPFPNPLQTELVFGLEEPKNGKIMVPSGDGLGVTVNARFVKANSR